MQLRVLPLQDNETFRVSQAHPWRRHYLLNKRTFLPRRECVADVYTKYTGYAIYIYYNMKQF